MRFSELIKKLSADLEYKGTLPANGRGGHSLLLDNGLLIEIEPYLSGYIFSSQSINGPQEKLEEFYTHALLANLYGQGTNGAILGLSHLENDPLILQIISEQPVEYPQFKATLDEFIQALDFWKDEVATF